MKRNEQIKFLNCPAAYCNLGLINLTFAKSFVSSQHRRNINMAVR